MTAKIYTSENVDFYLNKDILQFQYKSNKLMTMKLIEIF